MQKAVFLDRDGVINHDPGDYTYKLDEFTINEGVIEGLQLLCQAGYMLIIITNQGGIAKGRYGFDDVDKIHNHFLGICKENNIDIEEVYYCPHHSDLEKCLCRKPGSLFVEKAIARYNIDPKKSFFIGDKDRDIECGEACGVSGVKIELNTNLLEPIKSKILPA